MFPLKSVRLSREASSSRKNNEDGGGLLPYSRHPEYYFDDGNLVLQVENVLFRVFRSSFTRHSSLFKDIFSLPVTAGDVEGSSDGNPFHLAGISSVDFERLLSIIYPPIYGVHKPSSAEEWTSVLHLATRWDFASIRTLAIKELQTLPMSPVERIVLARRFDVDTPWAAAAYTALCQRAKPLSLEEARRLGLETATRIAQDRERLRSGSHKRAASASSSAAAAGWRVRDPVKGLGASSTFSPAFISHSIHSPARIGSTRPGSRSASLI